MGSWSSDELLRIAEADDLHVAPSREDGVTYGNPTRVWSVAFDDALYVRASIPAGTGPRRGRRRGE
jgi:hypothetical protein